MARSIKVHGGQDIPVSPLQEASVRDNSREISRRLRVRSGLIRLCIRDGLDFVMPAPFDGARQP
ncbi:hypothetical protein GCM10011400_64930 [Paraburkholderia caffeinilytica]|uniref:Uncharacterized protein n=1 Tax=Paraburkholderia caffeinilytica TaxID=1761016 RepID=A0ABQ1NBL1_9BURK|nr:hypothetical protein GCM10011400_64930 [Paraburkholderia caffeinilytica]